MSDDRRPTTKTIHAAPPEFDVHPLVTPIYETTTFVFENAAALLAYNEGRSSQYLYSRYGNPTVVAVEKTLAALDGAESALLFSSGMAATASILLGLTSTGDEVICASAIYGGTLHLLHDLLARFGVTTRFVSIDDLHHVDRVIGPKTRIVWFESPVNPTLRIVDVRAVAAGCRAGGVLAILDNTFASPINQQPLALGVDLVMQSATKYLNGHSDVTAGCVTGAKSLVDRVAAARRLLGTILDPLPAAALGRGLKTLAVRVERHNANALAVATFLAQDRRVSQVFYPGLPSDADHGLAARQMSGFGGMVCFDLGGSLERACACFDRLQLIQRAASLDRKSVV